VKESMRTAVRLWFQRFKSQASTVLCTGTSDGVASIQTDERWWRCVTRPSHL